MCKLHRRDFLRLAGAGTCGAYFHNLFRPVNSMMAYAAPVTASALGGNPIFILINQAGGCSLNKSPLYNGTYRQLNPNVSYGPGESIPLTSEQGLHPALTFFKEMYDQSKMALINAVGYPNQNRSHDQSTDVWQTGFRVGAASKEGWAARLTAQSASVFAGISLAGTAKLIQGQDNPPRALGNLQNFGESRFKGNDLSNWMKITRDNIMAQQNSIANAEFGHVKSAINNIELVAQQIKSATNVALPTVRDAYPMNQVGNGSFGNSIRDAARLILSNLPVRFVFIEQGGYDTHSDERDRLDGLLTELNAGVRFLMQVAEAAGRGGDIVIATMSEFGRTHRENSSEGTDHGGASPMFVVGGGIRGGILSPTPAESAFVNTAYLANPTVDFRQVYKEIVAAMGFNADMVFPEPISYTPLNLFT